MERGETSYATDLGLPKHVRSMSANPQPHGTILSEWCYGTKWILAPQAD